MTPIEAEIIVRDEIKRHTVMANASEEPIIAEGQRETVGALEMLLTAYNKSAAITVQKSLTADTRAMANNVSKEELLAGSVQHIGEVQKAMAWFAGQLINAGAIHDHTKISGIDDFYDSFSRKLVGNAFKAEKWYQSHLEERHHLNDRCPDDVTLIDVMERIADIVVAALARSGTFYDDDLSPEILAKAYKNTIELLKNNVVVRICSDQHSI